MLREGLFCSRFLSKMKRLFMVLSHFILQGATATTFATPIPPFCYYQLLGFNPEDFETLLNSLSESITELCL